ncbi:MAG: DUF4831 family protein [Roseburia sp.]|nr:DUF4831 family protein [Roseburia sp.]MCM1421643.1 DUF4831 family protein [Bacteroides sp.]
MVSGVKAQTQVTKFTPGIVAEGINYALPRTRVRIDVTALRIHYTPGEFARYADRFLNIGNVRKSEESKCMVVSMNIEQEGVPDTSKVYTVKLKDKTVAPLVQLTDDGVLVAVNTKSDIAAKVCWDEERKTEHGLNSKEYFTADILAATSTAKMAELTAAEIFDIRDSRSAIMRGQADEMPKDGASLKIVLDGLNKHEEALMQLFVGYTDTVTYTRSFYVDPQGDIDKQVCFRLSSKLGFVDADDLSGEPYYISIKNLGTVPTVSDKDSEKKKIAGLVYNMPGTAQVKIFNPDKTFVDKEMVFGQFGVVDVLSTTLFNKDATTKVTFNPVTGGIVRIEQ